MSKISVVIPTFNRAISVTRAIESALAQKLPPGHALEVVIVDDGSTDGTREAIAARFGKLENVRTFTQSNEGVSSARNHAIRESRGDLIAFLDSDDVWLPHKLALQLECLDRFPKAGMVWTDMAAVDATGRVLHSRYLRKMYHAYRWFKEPRVLFSESALVERDGRSIPIYSDDVYSQMVLGNLVHTSTVVLKKDRLPELPAAGTWFREDYRRGGEDYEFHLRLCRGGPVAFVDEVTTRYEIGLPDALTQPGNQIELAERFLATLIRTMQEDRARIRLPDALLIECLADAEGWLGRELLMAGRPQDARLHLRSSLAQSPLQWGLYKFVAASLLPDSVREPLIRWVRK